MSTLHDRVLAADDLSTQEVQIPEWKESVWVRTMASGERGKWEAMCIANKDRFSETQWREQFLVIVACNEDGTSLFAESDVAALATKNAKAIDRIFEAGMKLN